MANKKSWQFSDINNCCIFQFIKSFKVETNGKQRGKHIEVKAENRLRDGEVR